MGLIVGLLVLALVFVVLGVLLKAARWLLIIAVVLVLAGIARWFMGRAMST